MIPSLWDLEHLVVDPFFDQQEFSPALAKKYVNGDTGSDSNDGSIDHPYRSWTPIQNVPAGTAVITYTSSGGYTVPTGGLSLVGAPGQPIIFIGAPGLPRPVVDARPYSISGAFPPQNQNDVRVRQILDCSGSYVRVEHLDLQYGFRHCVNFRGSHMVLRDCHIYGAFEDGIKITAPFESPRDADVGLIIDNDVEYFASQGIDIVCAGSWLIKNNKFHNPQPDVTFGVILANGVGMKGGSPNIVLSGNHFYAIPGATNRGCIELGGTGDNFNMATTDCIATDNWIEGYAGPALVASSAVRAAMYRNLVTNCLVGAQIGLDIDVRTANPNSAFCSDVHLGNNYLRVQSAVGAMIRMSNVLDAGNFLSELNEYTGPNRFVKEGAVVDWTAFKAWLNTDYTSKFVPNKNDLSSSTPFLTKPIWPWGT